MSGIQRASRIAPDPVTYACAAVATIGIQHTTYGYFYHALQVGISVAMVTDLSVFSVVTCDIQLGTHTHMYTHMYTHLHYTHVHTPPLHTPPLHTQAYVLRLVPGQLLDLLVTVVAAKQEFLKKKAKKS